MLQNPSKYHANPLSHFLALHTTQANAHAHAQHPHGYGHGNGLPTAALAAAAAAAAVTAGQSSTSSSSYQMEQQHPPAHAHANISTHLAQANNHQASHQQQQQQHQAAATVAASTATSHAHLIEAAAAHTSLDVGKSFTIAAILGLQQSAIESQCKEYNNAINLSLNAGDVVDHQNNTSGGNNSNNNHINNNNNNNNSQSVNNFNCDSSSIVNGVAGSLAGAAAAASLAGPSALVNRYLPALHAAASGAPSALQSLQQLHQHHAHAQQQATLTFQREKLKSESHKKSALKNKRVRTIFTPEQLERLEAEFERQQYMVGPERLYLAHTLQLTEAQVKVWFQNRRIKWRKHHLELTQQRLALIRQSQMPSTATAATTTTAAMTTAMATTATELSMAGGAATTLSSPSLEDNEDSKHSLPLRRAASESDLSICNDSMDGDSLMDGSEEAT